MAIAAVVVFGALVVGLAIGVIAHVARTSRSSRC